MLTNYLEMIQSVERDREALLFSDRVYTYRNLADLALEKQKQLHLENRKQQLAVIRESSILEQLVAFLACQGTGAVPLIVPNDTTVPDAFFEIKIPDEACMAVMTSGTTGSGKLLFRTFESWYGYFETQNRIFGISGESRLFAQGSLAFTGNLNLYLAQLSAGAVVIACDLFDPRLWKQQLEAYRADGIYLIPAKLRALKQVYEREREPEKQTNRHIRLILSGSQSFGGAEALAVQCIFPHADLILYYGASELNYVSYVHGRDMGEDKTLIGRKFPDVDICLKDGRIHVTTPYGVVGAGTDTFVGDYGHWDEAGNLYFDGRRDDICNINGRKISSVRVENAMLDVPGVKEAAVKASSRGGHDTLMAWVVLDMPTAGTGPEAERQLQKQEMKRKIRNHLIQVLSASEIPQGILFLEALPKNESGKVRKRDLI